MRAMRKMKFLGVCAFLLLAWSAARAGTVTYVYTDPQGTVLAEADAQGNLTARFDYAPYGAQALGTPSAGPGYTGHVNDPDTGLVYMQARYYDPEMGRFPSVDPVGPTPGNVFNFNRYGYASNNPVINIDPDGRESACVSQKNHCSGENPAAKAAATSVLHYAYGALSAVANKWNGTFHAGTAEGGQIVPSNTAQAAGMLTGAIVTDLAVAVATDSESVGAAKIANPIPKTLARVIPAELNPSTLGASSATDVFVTDAAQINGLGSQQIARALTIPHNPSGYRVISFPSAEVEGIASPVNRDNPGFVGQGRTAGGASEFVIPNGPIPPNADVRVVQ